MDWIPIDGNSMRPFLEPGDQIAIHWEPTINTGDILLLRNSEGTTIVHRFLKRQIDSLAPLVIRGDRSYINERYFPEQVLGKVVAIRRKKSGRIQVFRTNFIDQSIAIFTRLGFRKVAWVLGNVRRWI
jgi:signal peptidase I